MRKVLFRVSYLIYCNLPHSRWLDSGLNIRILVQRDKASASRLWNKGMNFLIGACTRVNLVHLSSFCIRDLEI